MSATPSESDLTTRRIVAHVPAELALFDTQMRYLAASDRWMQVYGLEGKDLFGRCHYDLFPEITEEWKTVHRRALRGETIRASEDRFVRSDGTVQFLRWEVCPWYSDRGTIGGIFIAAEDVTERIQAQHDLRNSHDLLQAILDASGDAIITADRVGTIQSLNLAAERMFGYRPEELLGRNISIFMPPEFRTEHDDYLEKNQRSGEERFIGTTREVVAVRKDGSMFPAEVTSSHVPRLDTLTGVVRDLTDRRRAEAAARQSDRMASIGTLAAGLGHDLNNVLLPLRARLNALASAGREGELTKSARRHVQEIQRSVAYLQHLADGLHYLMVQTDERGESVEGGRSTNLRGWWSQTRILLGNALPRHAKLVGAFATSLPQARLAPHALTQAVLNLVVNAGQAITPDHGQDGRGIIRVEATTTTDDTGTWIRLAVRDNGSGMTDEVKRQATDLFFTTKPLGVGSGLGLALVRRVMDEVGGRVDIESSLGVGTAITLVIPAIPIVKRKKATRQQANAVISVRDSRTGSLIAQLLSDRGVPTEMKEAPGRSSIWIIDEHVPLAAASAWRRKSPSGALVRLTDPSLPTDASWHLLEPIEINSPDDLDAIRAGLTRVVAGP
ncbi:MAG: PAS domain S-box protein [Phycisphaerae bacterium]|nr:PAS domain S-box protein [Phycisphaerae bacterium]